MSTSFVRETQELKRQSPLSVPRWLTRKLKGFTFIKEREIAQPDCHERKEPTLILRSVCAGFFFFFFTFLICLGSHPEAGEGGYPHFRQGRTELANVTQQIVKLGGSFPLQSPRSFHCLWFLANSLPKRWYHVWSKCLKQLFGFKPWPRKDELRSLWDVTWSLWNSCFLVSKMRLTVLELAL